MKQRHSRREGPKGMEVAIEQAATGKKTSSRGGDDQFKTDNRVVEGQPHTGPQRLSVRCDGERERGREKHMSSDGGKYSYFQKIKWL